jgi:hypothetical protein
MWDDAFKPWHSHAYPFQGDIPPLATTWEGLILALPLFLGIIIHIRSCLIFCVIVSSL